MTGRDQHTRKDDGGGADRERDLLGGAPATRQKGHCQNHGNHAQILEHENAQSQTTVWRSQLATRGEATQDDRGAGYGNHAAHEYRGPRRQSEPPGQGGSTDDRKPHLNASTQQNSFPEATETFEGDLQADPEEQEDDANLGQSFNLAGIVHQAQCRGPGQRAGQDEPRYRRNTHATEYRHDHDRRTQNDD